MKHKLILIGNTPVLETGDKRKTFKDWELFCQYVNRFNLKDDIEGLDNMAQFWQNRVGYVPRTADTNAIGTIIETLMLSGFTNQLLIS